MSHMSPESQLQVLPATHGQESALEVSFVGPDRDCWQSVDYTFGSPRYEVSAVATRALDYFVQTTWPDEAGEADTLPPDVRRLSDKLRTCLRQAEGTALEMHERRLVAQAVELLAWQSPAELASSPRLTQYAGYIAAARQCVADFPELDDEHYTANALDDSFWTRPEAVKGDADADDPTVGALHPDTIEERAQPWHHSLKIGPLTLAITLQRTKE